MPVIALTVLPSCVNPVGLAMVAVASIGRISNPLRTQEGKPPWFQMHARGLGTDDRSEQMYFQGITPRPAREIVYLPKQDALLALLDLDHLYVFHCETNEWKHLDVVLPQGSYTHECSLDYDPVHDVAVALIPEGFSRRLRTLLFRYDLKTAKYKSTNHKKQQDD